MKHIESILVATDLTEDSDPVLQTAAALAAITGAQLHLLHAFEFEYTPYAKGNQPGPTFQARIAEAEQALDAQIKRTVRNNLPVASKEIIIYIAFKAIRERARAVAADLIVLGRHRHRTVGDSFLGGTADRVIRSVDVPCLIVHTDTLTLPLRRVVVPIDLSAPAIGALDVALTWTGSFAPKQEPELIVLHVIPRVFSSADVPLDDAVIGDELKRQTDAARMRTGIGNGPRLREELRWGDSATDEITKFAETEQADLVIMGTHGHGAFKRALIGSVASGVARSASCPVLLVPPSLWATESSDDEIADGS
jgi:nucleotide-binding universal stress UspA family protein